MSKAKFYKIAIYSKLLISNIWLFILVPVLFSLILVSCNKGIEQKLSDKVNKECSSDNCIVSIKDITNFKWDRMYVFKYTARKSEIEKVIGTKYNPYLEFHRKIIFLLDGKIVYNEELPTNIESLIDGEVVFDIDDAATYRMYTPDNAIFQVKKEKFDKGIYYQLNQISTDITSNVKR